MLHAFDTDILTLIGHGDAGVLHRLQSISITDRAVPIVVAEEALRGRLAMVRQAESKRGRLTLDDAYDNLQKTLEALKSLRLLPFTPQAELLVQNWRNAKIRVGTQDLRIAAIAVVYGATLVTRNARDFSLVPGLTLDVWPGH